MRDEFDSALKKMKGRKAPGINELTEFVKAADNGLKDALYTLVCDIYDIGVLPRDFKCFIVSISIGNCQKM